MQITENIHALKIPFQVADSMGFNPCGSVSLFLPSEGALFTGDAVPVRGDLLMYRLPSNPSKG